MLFRSVFGCLHFLAVSSDQVNSVSTSINSVFLPGLIFLFTALSLRAAREQWFNLGFWGYVGIVWLTPILACLVLAVDDFLGNSELMLHLSSLSPITFFPQLITYLSPQLFLDRPQLIDFSLSVKTGTISVIVLTLLLTFRLFRSNKT